MSYNKDNNIFELERSDYEGDNRFAKLTDYTDNFNFHILLDTSSLEIFINNGEVVSTERFYSNEKPNLSLEIKNRATSVSLGEFESYELDSNAVSSNKGE